MQIKFIDGKKILVLFLVLGILSLIYFTLHSPQEIITISQSAPQYLKGVVIP